MNRLDELDDEAIDRMWRARYGQPLPVMGSAAIARKILTEWMSEPCPKPTLGDEDQPGRLDRSEAAIRGRHP